jgi:hypothetical protein
LTRGNLPEDQIKLALANLDLSFVFNQIQPSLDGFHWKRLDKVLGEVLSKSAFWLISQATIKQNLLDYRTVQNVPGRVTIPDEESATEIVMPEVEVEENRKDNSINEVADGQVRICGGKYSQSSCLPQVWMLTFDF